MAAPEPQYFRRSQHVPLTWNELRQASTLASPATLKLRSQSRRQLSEACKLCNLATKVPPYVLVKMSEPDRTLILHPIDHPDEDAFEVTVRGQETEINLYDVLSAYHMLVQPGFLVHVPTNVTPSSPIGPGLVLQFEKAESMPCRSRKSSQQK